MGMNPTPYVLNLRGAAVCLPCSVMALGLWRAFVMCSHVSPPMPPRHRCPWDHRF